MKPTVVPSALPTSLPGSPTFTPTVDPTFAPTASPTEATGIQVKISGSQETSGFAEDELKTPGSNAQVLFADAVLGCVKDAAPGDASFSITDVVSTASGQQATFTEGTHFRRKLQATTTALIVSYDISFLIVDNSANPDSSLSLAFNIANTTRTALLSNIQSGVWNQIFQTAILTRGFNVSSFADVSSNAVTVLTPALLVITRPPTSLPTLTPTAVPSNINAAAAKSGSDLTASPTFIPVWVGVGVIVLAIIAVCIYYYFYKPIDSSKQKVHVEAEDYDFGLSGTSVFISQKPSQSPISPGGISGWLTSTRTPREIVLGDIYEDPNGSFQGSFIGGAGRSPSSIYSKPENGGTPTGLHELDRSMHSGLAADESTRITPGSNSAGAAIGDIFNETFGEKSRQRLKNTPKRRSSITPKSVQSGPYMASPMPILVRPPSSRFPISKSIYERFTSLLSLNKNEQVKENKTYQRIQRTVYDIIQRHHHYPPGRPSLHVDISLDDQYPAALLLKILHEFWYRFSPSGGALSAHERDETIEAFEEWLNVEGEPSAGEDGAVALRSFIVWLEAICEHIVEMRTLAGASVSLDLEKAVYRAEDRPKDESIDDFIQIYGNSELDDEDGGGSASAGESPFHGWDHATFRMSSPISPSAVYPSPSSVDHTSGKSTGAALGAMYHDAFGTRTRRLQDQVMTRRRGSDTVSDHSKVTSKAHYRPSDASLPNIRGAWDVSPSRDYDEENDSLVIDIAPVEKDVANLADSPDSGAAVYSPHQGRVGVIDFDGDEELSRMEDDRPADMKKKLKPTIPSLRITSPRTPSSAPPTAMQRSVTTIRSYFSASRSESDRGGAPASGSNSNAMDDRAATASLHVHHHLRQAAEKYADNARYLTPVASTQAAAGRSSQQLQQAYYGLDDLVSILIDFWKLYRLPEPSENYLSIREQDESVEALETWFDQHAKMLAGSVSHEAEEAEAMVAMRDFEAWLIDLCESIQSLHQFRAKQQPQSPAGNSNANPRAAGRPRSPLTDEAVLL
jgi:hypothetical protein